MILRGAPGSRQTFVDTSAYYSLTDPRDINHAEARAISRRLTSERWRLFTTNFVIAETHALLLTRLGRTTARRVLQEIDRSTTTIIRIGEAEEHRARQIIEQYDDKDFSLTDATSFAVMERLRIACAFTVDGDFRQFGVQVLTAERSR
jgi:uncharacterized protein